ncbi:ankyrin repeat-containing protein BDA1-like [Nicotiana tabacum]|uniref:Ankyrin repeat protein RF_0381 n=1 Tax=Nicotiana tabacum TaxID=4097 RepID=A0A1S4B0V2_TOBAC|nr:PREDICTED: putative ankyrin repeat protein RF_0381 [Nicotiana tabacum]
MDQILTDVCEAGDINDFYLLNPDLERIDEIPFVDTPLHIAASAGKTQLAIEILSLKPSFGRKLNSEGLSPLHSALKKGHVETAKRLIKHDPELIRVRGRERITPLHYVAETENINLLGEFLYACPASIKDLTISGETALHVAVKTSKLNCVLVLLGWLQRTNNREILKLKDENGDTVLHIAVSTNQLQIVKLLIKNMKNINEKNMQGLTALDIAMGPPDEQNREMKRLLRSSGASTTSSLKTDVLLSDFLGSKETISEKFVKYDVNLRKGLSNDVRNALLVVAILIATATYQALLSPPGDVTQGDGSTTTTAGGGGRPGTVVLPKKYFNPITYTNTICFVISVGLIIFLVQTSRYSLPLQMSLVFMMLSYMISLLAIFPPGKVAAYAVISSSIVIIYARFLGSMEYVPGLRWLLGYDRLKLQRKVVLSKYAKDEFN